MTGMEKTPAYIVNKMMTMEKLSPGGLELQDSNILRNWSRSNALVEFVDLQGKTTFPLVATPYRETSKGHAYFVLKLQRGKTRNRP